MGMTVSSLQSIERRILDLTGLRDEAKKDMETLQIQIDRINAELRTLDIKKTRLMVEAELQRGSND
jgi:hypothetical protein